MKFARLLLRLVVGFLMFGHGTQKLFGWFGGGGVDGTAQMFEQLGLRPGRRNAIASGAAEAGGGALLIAGLATPLAAATIVGVMLTAINRVHLKNGPWAANRGYEYNLVLIAAMLLLADAGPGGASIDAALGIEQHGSGWALAALLGGVAGAGAVHVAASTHAERAPEPAGEPASAPVSA
ncbi:MAG: DoxX family protein [Solirubrobacterales bacterium]|nr:DoxX family protein [Solirubrobacterales bacterium]